MPASRKGPDLSESPFSLTLGYCVFKSTSGCRGLSTYSECRSRVWSCIRPTVLRHQVPYHFCLLRNLPRPYRQSLVSFRSGSNLMASCTNQLNRPSKTMFSSASMKLGSAQATTPSQNISHAFATSSGCERVPRATI